MKSSVIHALLFAGMIAALAGCQSAGRWAWWRDGNASDATTVAENTTAPALPSASATPHAVMPAGLQPAASPSAANLAATGVPAGAISVPLLSAPSTSAPSTPQSAAAVIANTPIPGVPTIPGVDAGQQVASVPSAGPYDPNGYKPSTSAGIAGASAGGAVPAVADRYGLASATRYSTPASHSAESSISPPSDGNEVPAPVAPAAENRYADVGTVPTAPGSSVGDRYGQPAAPAATSPVDRYGKLFAEPAPSDVAQESTAVPAPSTAPAIETIPPSASPSGSAQSQSATTVQLKSPAGQYRPGGTTSYTVSPVQHIATLPSAPGANQAPATAPANTGGEASSPVVPALPATGAGTRY